MQRGYSLIILIVVFGVLAVISGGFYFYLESKKVIIDSFEDCAKKYSVMESYPEQCRTPDGRLFVSKLIDEEKSKLMPSEDVPSQNGFAQDPANSLSNWVTYTNSKSRYTVKLPKTAAYCVNDLSVDIHFNNPGGCPFQTAADLNIYVHSEEPIYTIYEQTGNNPYPITIKEEDLVVGDEKVKKISYFLMQDYPEDHLSKGLFRVRYIRQINNVWFDMTDFDLTNQNQDKLSEEIIFSIKLL